jgi:hypothetical protein
MKEAAMLDYRLAEYLHRVGKLKAAGIVLERLLQVAPNYKLALDLASKVSGEKESAVKK